MAGALLVVGLWGAGDACALDVWTSHGPSGGAIRSLAIDPSDPAVMYATLDGGIARSRDGGVSWVRRMAVGADLVRRIVLDPAHPGRLYLTASGQGGFLRSDDYGDTWREIDGGVTGRFIDALALDGGHVYAGGFSVFRSADAGEQWERAAAGLPPGFAVDALVADPSRPGLLYAGGGEYYEPSRDGPVPGLYRTTDGGGSWAPAALGLPEQSTVQALVIDPQDTATLYAAVGRLLDGGGVLGEGVYKSVDGAATWQRTTLSRYYLQGLTLDAQHSNRVYAYTFDILAITGDGGVSWRMPNNAGSYIEDLIAHPMLPDVLYAATDSGLRRSLDGAASWEPFGETIIASNVPAVAVHPSAPRTAYAVADGALVRTVDGGLHWERRGIADTPLLVDGSSATTLYAAGCCPGIARSDDEGLTWQTSNTGLPADGYVTHLVRQPSSGALYVALAAIADYDDGGVWRSDDAGATWHPAHAGLAGHKLTTLVAHPQVAGLLYATDDESAWRSEDGGTSWQLLEAAPSGVRWALAVSASDPDLVWLANSQTLSVSQNRGTSWEAVLLPDVVTNLAIDPRAPRTGYASLYFGGVIATDDGGQTWRRLAAGLPTSSPVLSLAIDHRFPARIYAGTEGAGVPVLVRSDRLPCAADCDASGRVLVDEIVTAVRIGLGEGDPAACAAADADDDGRLAIDDLVRAVRAALAGCQVGSSGGG